MMDTLKPSILHIIFSQIGRLSYNRGGQATTMMECHLPHPGPTINALEQMLPVTNAEC
jgi:hypothetical protein